MPAINIPMFVKRPKVMLSPYGVVSDRHKVGGKPTGTNTLNPNAKYYDFVERSEKFIVFVPVGYAITSLYLYDKDEDEWYHPSWEEQSKSTDVKDAGYIYFVDRPDASLQGFTSYLFMNTNEDYADFGENGGLVRRNYMLSFDIRKSS